jgi:rhodanese-related sulfurtransferase
MTQKSKRISSKPVKKGISSWIFAAVIVVIIAGIYLLITPQPQTSSNKIASEVTVEEASKLREEGAFILDVREKDEWIQFHIPGATLIPLETLPNELTGLPKDKTIVVVCRTGRRSAEGRDILLNAGFTNVTSMAGGVTEWMSKGFPIDTGE